MLPTARPRGLLPAIAMSLLAVACGTTVHGTQAASLGAGTAPNEAGLSNVTSGATPTAPTGRLAGNAGSVASGGSVSAVGVQTTRGAVGTRAAAHGPRSASASAGPGVTATSVSIGVAYFQNANAANAAIGGKGIAVSDPTTTARAIVAALNRSGGIAGRRVLPLFFGVDPQSSTPYATEAQAECSYFTEDHHVLAVIDGTQAVGALARPCLQQHGVAFTTDNTAVISDVGALEIDPDAILWSRLFASLVPSLTRQNWFAPWNRVSGSPGGATVKTGIVTADRPALNRAVDGVLVPLLRRAGYAPAAADIIRIAPPSGFTDDGATVAAIDNAALKLNSDGVDHVILTDANGSISLLFNNYAYSQHYFPRYGGSTGNFWQTLLAAGDIQSQTLRGAMGIGFAPVLDVPFKTGRGPYPNSTRDRCLAIMRGAGLASTSASVEASQLTACDAFLLLQRALQSARTVNADALVQAVTTLGDAFQPGLSLGDHFDADQRDGIGMSADMAFEASCGCFRYQGPRRPLTR